MSRPYDMEAAEQLSRDLLSWLQMHRDVCESNDCEEPANLLAYLCHTVGIKVTDLGKLQRWLAEYESKCQNCAHTRN